ncbi:MAG: hypothetical protein EBT39_03830, partial [Sphingobacteriia bacterium]|nr:hypothetical protein [Candidatus Fonsibacter lacus]
EKYQSYTDLQKQILGILFRTKKIEKDDLKYFTTRLLRYMPKEDKEKWMTAIKKVIGYSNLFDFYDIKDTLGKGKFGLVK